MAQVAALVILDKLFREGKISFNEDDLVGQTPAVQRVLYSYGAYKNQIISEECQFLFGIRELKKLIDVGIDINEMSTINLFKIIYEESVQNIEFIFQEDIDSIFDFLTDGNSRYGKKKLIKNIKSWKKIKSGRDVRLSGFGKINIIESYNKFKDYSRQNNFDFFKFPSLNNIRAIGYFPKDTHKARIYEIERISKLFTKKNMPILLWCKRNEFPLSRFDELIEATILGFFNTKMTKRQANKALEEINDRNLKLTRRDEILFDYEKNKSLFSFLIKQRLTLPENGIELKKQAKMFKNCAGGYVEKILDKKTIIAYNDEMMIELNPNSGEIKQAFRPMNQPIIDDKNLQIINNIKNKFQL